MIAAVAKTDSISDGSLASVAWEVVHRDVTGKTEAVVAAIRSIPVEPEVSAVLRSLQRLDACVPRAARGPHPLLDDGWLDRSRRSSRSWTLAKRTMSATAERYFAYVSSCSARLLFPAHPQAQVSEPRAFLLAFPYR